MSTTAELRLEARETVLPNGLRLLLLSDPASAVVSYQVHLAAGSRHERPGITGISHLFEHMMFKGTPTVGPEEFARAIQGQGGSLNAFTTEDSTCFYETLPADRLDLAIRLEADRQANLLLTEENLASEREVVRNERLLRTVNTPYGEARELLMALALLPHPYRWPVVGWDGDLRSMTLQDCHDYYRTFYAPNNTTVVVAGGFDADAAQRGISDAYAGLAPQPAPPALRTFEESQVGERRAIFRKRVEAEAFLAGFHVPGLSHADTLPLLALSDILSGGESSRLFRLFVRPARAGSVSTGLGTSVLNRDPTLFRVEAICNPGEHPGDLEARIWEEIARLRQDGVTPEELERARRRLVAGFALESESAFHRGLQLGLAQTRADDWRWANRFVPGCRALSSTDVDRAARAYLTPENRTVVTVLAAP